MFVRVAVQSQFVPGFADFGQLRWERFESVAWDEECCFDVVAGEEG
jgi:hypothetical protein